MNKINHDSQFVLEPTYTSGETLFACELLSNFSTPENPHFVIQEISRFNSLSSSENLSPVEAQLHIAIRLSKQPDVYTLISLSHYCPLWLDNFGVGSTSINIALAAHFEYIKINKSFFWKFDSGNIFQILLVHIHSYFRSIIIADIKNETHRKMVAPLNTGDLQKQVCSPTHFNYLFEKAH